MSISLKPDIKQAKSVVKQILKNFLQCSVTSPGISSEYQMVFKCIQELSVSMYDSMVPFELSPVA